MTYYREGEMRPTNCEQCDCQKARWNGSSAVLWGDPPTTCTCGHRFSRHVYRTADLSDRHAMTNLDDVRAARGRVDAAEGALRRACVEALADHPLRQVAMAAGKTRQTIYNWAEEEAQRSG